MNLDPGDLILRDPNQKDFISLSNFDLEFRFKGFRCKGPGFKELQIMCFWFLVYIWETYFQRLSFNGPNLKDFYKEFRFRWFRFKGPSFKGAS